MNPSDPTQLRLTTESAVAAVVVLPAGSLSIPAGTETVSAAPCWTVVASR